MIIDMFKEKTRVSPDFKGLGDLVATVIVILLVVAGTLFSPLGVSADGNDELNESARYFLRGDVVSAGVGLRGVGFGDIILNGIPTTASVSHAFLYWATLGSANTYTSPTLDGEFVFGELIGTSAGTDWLNAPNNFVYRADVTDLVDGNGFYTIAGLPSDLETGNDSQGASLVVVYSDANEPFRTILINDGAVTLNPSNLDYTAQFDDYPTDDPVSDAHITYLVGDGQEEFESGIVEFEGDNIGMNVFNSTDGFFWDTLTFDVTENDPDAPADTTLNIISSEGDYLLWAASVLSVTSGPPVQAENDLSKSFDTLVLGSVTSAGVGLRGTGQGDITISGVPIGTSVVRSFLYWATIGSVGSFDSPTLNGEPVNGELIGISNNTCWPGAQNNFVYRADVTSIVDSNGTYAVDDLPSDLETGNDSQGASLVVVYSSNLDRPLHQVIINDGAVTLDLDTNQYTDTISGFKRDDPVSDAHVTYLIGDGQSTWSNGSVRFNGISLATNVFNGADGDYWGTLTFDISALNPLDPSTTTINNENPDDPDSPDCLLWGATVFTISLPEPGDQTTYLPVVLQRPANP